EFSPVVARRLPLLTEATRWVGHLPIRTRGTIGGSIAHADPSAEYPAVLTALDGEVVARGPKGERVLKPRDFFQTYLTTNLAADALARAAAKAQELVQPDGDIHASADYRRHLTGVLTGRAVKRALTKVAR